MPELIKDECRKARKRHLCNYCGHDIEPGEKYNYSLLKDGGDVYSWRAHEKCNFIATELWDYIDPWEGLDEDQFQEGCFDFSRAFVCPDCEKWDMDAGCDDDESYCLDKIYELLQKYELVCIGRDRWYRKAYKLKERKAAADG